MESTATFDQAVAPIDWQMASPSVFLLFQLMPAPKKQEELIESTWFLFIHFR